MEVRRLKTREQFQALLACTPVARTEHFVMHRMDLGADPMSDLPATSRPFAGAVCWLGAMVPKRWARRAATRNLLKRQVYRWEQLSLPAAPAAYLVRLRSGFDVRKFPSAASQALRTAARAEIEQLFRRVSSGAARA